MADKKMEPLRLDEWEHAVRGMKEDVKGEEFPPILCEAKTSAGVIELIEFILGEFIWDIWDEAKILKPLVDEDVAGYATIQYEGKPCRDCGNYSGTITYFDRNGKELTTTEFSD
jgi:hypothetical protein